MHGGRIHRKVWLWWGSWWAIQGVADWYDWSLGVRVNLRRPLLDLYFGPLTIGVGRHAVYSDPRTRTSDSCRGMLFADDPHWPLDERQARVL